MKNTSSLVFTGDIGFDRYMFGQWNDPGFISPEILAFLHSADHVIPNVEGPIFEAPKNEITSGVQQLLHTISPEAAKVLENMGADIWNICNNHIMDARGPGVRSTLDIAAECGARTIGAGMNLADASAPVIIDEAGGIGLFGVGYARGCWEATEDGPGCLRWNRLDIIQQNINKIKQTCRWCVIVAHAGEEFTSLPNPYTRERYHKYLEMGADAVVAHHPHVPMNYETVGEKYIFYSLGNFIFDTDYQRSQFNTEKGVAVKLTFTENSIGFEPMGIKINRENEHIEKADLPLIFTDVQSADYDLLVPLSAKAFIAATKRQMTFLKPEEFAGADEAKWEEHFSDEKRTGRVPGEALDFFLIRPLAAEAEKGEWKKSGLENVKKYILEQM